MILHHKYVVQFCVYKEVKSIHVTTLSYIEAKGVTVKSLGQTISGREIDCITCGNGPNVCWVIHRQHPGEILYPKLSIKVNVPTKREQNITPPSPYTILSFSRFLFLSDNNYIQEKVWLSSMLRDY